MRTYIHKYCKYSSYYSKKRDRDQERLKPWLGDPTSAPFKDLKPKNSCLERFCPQIHTSKKCKPKLLDYFLSLVILLFC